MKTNDMKWMGIFAAAILVFQGTALAEMIQGQVTAVNTENRSVTIQRDALGADANQKSEQIDLSIPENAEFRGIQSFDEVEVGDEVRAEANKPALGIGKWETRWIEKSDEALNANARTSAGLEANDRTQMQAGQESAEGQVNAAGETSAQNQPRTY